MSVRTSGEHRVFCLLGPVTVELNTDEPAVVDYLEEFYPLTTETTRPPEWVVDARIGAAPGMRHNRYGVAYAVDPSVREIVVRAPDPRNLAMSTRKTVREALVGFCERRRYTMLHASAVAGPDRVIIVVGDKGSGKTTLALRGTLEHGLTYLSNDHLIVYLDAGDGDGDGGDPAGLVLTSLPTPIPVKVGTYLDLEHLLPEPWDSEGVDLVPYRGMTPAERYRHDVRVLYTYRRFGQANPVTTRLLPAPEGPRVTVVLARYAGDGEPVDPPLPVADPVTALMEHVRFDWMFDPMLNQRHIPRRERDRPAYTADAERLVEALVSRAEVVTWAHRGDLAPLLQTLGGA